MGIVRGLATLFEAVTVFASVPAVAMLLSGLQPGQTAIQTGASAAAAVATIAIPYCVAGAFHRNAARAQLGEIGTYEDA